MRAIYVLTFLTILTSCENQLKFDSKKWKESTDLDTYPNRESMLSDIIDNKKFIGQSYQSVIESLGLPEDQLDNVLWYSVTVDYGTNIDPVHTKHLTLTINKDSIVEKVEIKEWRKN